VKKGEKSPAYKHCNHDRKNGGFLGKPGTFSRKLNIGCLVIIVPLFCFAAWMFYNANKSLRLRENISLMENNLRSILTSCQKYWENNPTGSCSLPPSRQQQLDWGLDPSKVEITIINGQKDSFITIAKQYENDIIFQIDNNGDTYIKVNDCLLQNRSEWLKGSIEDLEKACKKQKLAEEKLAAAKAHLMTEKDRIKKEIEKSKMARSSDGRFIAHGDGTITDTKTYLMWTREDSYAALGKCLDWNSSKNYVRGLISGDHSDWRIPTIKELKTIYEESKSNSSSKYGLIHLDAIFEGSAAHCYWSSELDKSGQSRVLFFNHGGVDKWPRTYCIGGVRAVRSIK
jgi:hypothetical protein